MNQQGVLTTARDVVVLTLLLCISPKTLHVVVCMFVLLLVPISAYAFDDVLSNNQFNSTKAWNLAKALGRPIDCGTISYNPVVENLQRNYDNLSDVYDILVNINNNHSMFGQYNYLPESYFNDLYNTLTNMRHKLDDIRNDINNRTTGNFQVGLQCAGFNMAYEIYKGYQDANRTYPR
jgi:hypothetical protein